MFRFDWCMNSIGFFTISGSLLMYTFFDITVMYLKILFFYILMNHSATTDFPSLWVKKSQYYYNHDLIDLL